MFTIAVVISESAKILCAFIIELRYLIFSNAKQNFSLLLVSNFDLVDFEKFFAGVRHVPNEWNLRLQCRPGTYTPSRPASMVSIAEK